jgi:ATP-dependent DNA ligase
VLARRGDSAYHPGAASPARLCVELRPRATCVVVGVEAGRRTPFGRLLLAEYAAGTLVISARADVPHDLVQEQWLRRTITPLLAPAATAQGVTGQGVRWLQPRLCASVAYSRRHADGRIADAHLLALRDDLDPAWCVRRPPLDPPRLETGGAFLPTVLMPLPLEDSLLLPRQRR